MSTPPFLDPPVGVRRTEIASRRGPFAALEGEVRAGQTGTVLLVPGFTGSKEDFVTVLGPLLERGYRPVAIDQRGQYETPGPPDAASYSLDAWAADLVAVAGATGGPVHVVGHSFGGLVARSALLLDPRPFASVTLLCSGPAALPDEHHDRTRLFADVLEAHGSDVLWRAIQEIERAEGNPPPPDPTVAAFLEERFRRNSPGCLVAMARTLVSETSRDDELVETSVPLHVVAGVDDTWWPVRDQERRAARLRAPFTLVQGAAHSPAVEQPELTTDVLTTFWDGIR